MPSRDTFADFLAVCFLPDFWTPKFSDFPKLFGNFGLHLESIWHAFWRAWEPRKWSQNVDGSTILTLWTSFFQARFLGLNLLPTFSRLFALLGILGLHLGALLAPFGSNDLSNIIVQAKGRKQGLRVIPRNLEWGVLAPKEEDLRPPSSSKACRI